MATVTTADVDVLRQARIDLATALRAAALYGYNEGVDNHFSLAVPGRDDRFLLNRFGPHWSEIRPEDLLLLDLDGTIVDGEGEAERTAFVIHRAVHQAQPHARCVLHTHMPYATAISMTADGFDTCISQNAMMFHGRITRLEYGGHAQADDEGARIASAVREDTCVVMLENHGVLAIGSSVAEAWHKLYFLERAAEAQVLAQSTGQTLIRVSDEVAAVTAQQWQRESSEHSPLLFDAVRRQLEREAPL